MQLEKLSNEVVIINNNDNLKYITDTNSAIDLIASIDYETKCNKIIIYKENICNEFFDLKTQIAGEILQKFVNYNYKLCIIGNFENIDSKALKDFIYECNNGNCIYFAKDLTEAKSFYAI